MGLLAGKRVFSIMALCMMVGLLLLPIVVALPSPAIGGDAPAGDAAKKDGDKVEKGRDVYYKTEGIVLVLPPLRQRMVPRTIRGTTSRAVCSSGSPISSISIMAASCWLCLSSA